MSYASSFPIHLLAQLRCQGSGYLDFSRFFLSNTFLSSAFIFINDQCMFLREIVKIKQKKTRIDERTSGWAWLSEDQPLTTICIGLPVNKHLITEKNFFPEVR